jgi:hypothetical protein
MTKLDCIGIAQPVAGSLVHLVGVLRMAYQAEAEPLIECVRGSAQHVDGTTEYAFAAIKRRESVK